MLRLAETRLRVRQGSIPLLEEDVEALSRTILSLEYVNDRLNFQLQKNREELAFLGRSLRLAEQQTLLADRDIKRLRETNFELESEKETVEVMRKEAHVVGKRFTGKIQTVRKLEKRLSLMVKSKPSF